MSPPELTLPMPLPEPTINSILTVAATARVDRVSIVRQPTPDRPAAIAIFMIGDAATRALGPYLIAIFKGLRDVRNYPITITSESPIYLLFNTMVSNGQAWCWTELEPKLLLAAVVGPTVNNDFCAQLTARGCASSLQ